MSQEKKQWTHFGFESVKIQDKVNRVKNVFDNVSQPYDRMNDAMSFGLHRVWKKQAIQSARLFPGQTVLDVAGGSADLSLLAHNKVQPGGRVILSDINQSMLKVGVDKCLNRGVSDIPAILADAESLPFQDGTFDRILLSFGLRNMTDQTQALKELFRCLKPGGQLTVLEFSHPTTSALAKCYDWYSFHVIPKLGRFIADDPSSYQYLVESIRKHPNQEDLKDRFESVGFDCQYQNLNGGIVAIHTGVKPCSPIDLPAN